jgi:methylglutaconyl-CoA hydratase
VDDAIEWIQAIANGAPIAQAAALEAIDASFDASLEQGLILETHAYEKTLASDDRLEALKAFAEKRKPVFRGQ